MNNPPPKDHQAAPTAHAVTLLPIIITLVSVLCSAGCDEEKARTAGEPVQFLLAVAGEVAEAPIVQQRAAPKSFQSLTMEMGDGWQVELSRAEAAVGPIYLYEGAPGDQQQGPVSRPHLQSAWERLARLAKLVREAQACASEAFYSAGRILGQLQAQTSVDLLATAKGATPPAHRVSGLAGTIREVEVHLHPPGALDSPSPDELEDLGGFTVVLEGIARHRPSPPQGGDDNGEGVCEGDLELPFRARLNIPESDTMRIVPRIPAQVVLDRSLGGMERDREGAVHLLVALDQVLASVSWGALSAHCESVAAAEAGQPPTTGVCEIEEDTQAWTALMHGIRSRHAYRLDWGE